MSQSETIAIYYDASCPFCSVEINNIKHYDDDERITLVDCSAPDFDTEAFESDKITQQDMMNALHIRDDQGKWHIGVKAFEKMYRHVGFNKISALCSHPITKPVVEKVYPIIVKNRYILSKLGMVQVLSWWGRHAARDAAKRAAACKGGACKY